jgi:LacI family transcriptional regulator
MVMATIKDIARLADVGIGTVSRVLNGGDKVKPETAERILRIAEELGYRPNRIAQSLVRKQDETVTIGLILPQQIREIHFEVIKGIYRYMTDHRIHLSAYKSNILEKGQIKELTQSNVHGLLILDFILQEEQVKILKNSRIPFLHLGQKVLDLSCISINHTKGGILAARHLASKNVHRAAFVGLLENADIQDQILEGFKEESIRRNIEIVSETNVPMGDQEGYKVTRLLWQRGDVEGIFFASDELAYGSFRFFREVNQGLPVIGYGDIPASKILSLSTVRYPSHQIGYLGAEKLVEIINAGTFNEIISIELLPDLVTRKS